MPLAAWPSASRPERSRGTDWPGRSATARVSTANPPQTSCGSIVVARVAGVITRDGAFPPMARRTARARHAFERDHAHDQARPRGARVEGLLSVPQREDPELHRQRRERLLSLLRL